MTQKVNLAKSIHGITQGITDIITVFLGEDKLWEKEKYPVEVNDETLQTVFNPEHEDYDKVASLTAFIAMMYPDLARTEELYDFSKLKSDLNAIVTFDLERYIEKAQQVFMSNNDVSSFYGMLDEFLNHYKKSVIVQNGNFKAFFEGSRLNLGPREWQPDVPRVTLPYGTGMILLGGIKFDSTYGNPIQAEPYPFIDLGDKADEVKALFKAKDLLDGDDVSFSELIIFDENWNTPQVNEFDLVGYLSSI